MPCHRTIMLQLVCRSSPFALLLLVACSGCRLWNAEMLPVRDSLSAEMLDAMRQQLNRDSWRPNPKWSPLEINFDESASRQLAMTNRWLFGSGVLGDAVSELDTARQTAVDSAVETQDDSQKVAADRRPKEGGRTATTWDGFWPLDVEHVLDSLDVGPASNTGGDVSSGLGREYLKRIAEENTLSGWNAAILLAQRDPEAAREFLPVLKRLVISYPDREDPRDDNLSRKTDTVSEEPIASLVERVTQQLNQELEAEKKTASPGGVASKQTEQSAQAKLVESLRDRLDALTRRINDDTNKDNPERISESMRAAAAEAWCLALVRTGSDSLQDLAEAGRVLERADLPNQVRGELYRSLASHISPALLPRLSNAMRISKAGERVPQQVRLAAVESCLIHALTQSDVAQTAERSTSSLAAQPTYDASLWPPTILNCRSDSDTAIRRTFGRWVAVVAYEGDFGNAASILEDQLGDRQTRVRFDALASLGWLGTPEARTLLRKQTAQAKPVVRAAAVNGLSHWGINELAPFVSDDSSLVRQAVAKRLGQLPPARSFPLMQQLLTDADLQVQAAAVNGIHNWPDDPALTLLLIALRDSSAPTRRIAFQELRKRRAVWDAFAEFDSPRREKRVRAVEKLGTRLEIPLQFHGRSEVASVEDQSRSDSLFARDVDALLTTVIDSSQRTVSPQRAAAVAKLLQLQPKDVPVIEEFLSKQKQPGSNEAFVFRELLPRLSPAYAALRDLDHPELSKKRRAAQQLRESAGARSLSPLMIRRLLPHLHARQDVLIWRDAMSAAMHDATDDHAQVALRALNDERGDIRLLGCDYILLYPRPQYANWIQQLELFGDNDKRVRLAAIEAVGRCGNPTVLADRAGAADSTGRQSAGATRLPGLRSLLTHSDAETRIAVVISMARLSDRQGMQELAKLSWSPEPKTRQLAVRAMGETQNPWFVEPLIRHGWTERHVDVRRAILHSLKQLTLPGKRPADNLDEIGYDAKIKSWHEWLEAGRKPRVDS